MFEQYFGMEHTQLSRDISIDRLYESQSMRETLGRLLYVADRQLFAVVTADPGYGKSTLLRESAQRQVYRPLSVRLQTNPQVVLQGAAGPAGTGIPVLPGRFQTAASAGD